MRPRRYSPLDQSCFRDPRASAVRLQLGAPERERRRRPPSPGRVECLLSALLVGLCLGCAGGCPSRASPDANNPRGPHSADQGRASVPARQETPQENANQQPTTNNQQPPAVPRYGYKVVRTYSHDPQAFTQGLAYEDGVLYEGTGIQGQSSLTKQELETGKILKRERLPRQYFGEGITVFRDKVIQLTWQSQTGFVYDKATFRLLREFKYEGEGWGLTHDGKQLIMSDGTATLRFLDPNTFAETRRITVRDETGPVDHLNELEFIPGETDATQTSWRGRPALASRGHPGLASSNEDVPVTMEEQGQDALATTETPPAGRDRRETGGAYGLQPTVSGLIFANIWMSDRIAIIDPDTGRVTAWLDLSALYPRPAGSEHVLNGIAYLPETKHLLITGKLWPKLYEIELTPARSNGSNVID